MKYDNLMTLNDLGRLLEEVEDNSGNVKGDAKLLHRHVHSASFGETTAEIRAHYDEVHIKIINSPRLLDVETHRECSESLQELVFMIYLTLTKRQLKTGFSSTPKSIEYIRRRLFPAYALEMQEEEARQALMRLYD